MGESELEKLKVSGQIFQCAGDEEIYKIHYYDCSSVGVRNVDKVGKSKGMLVAVSVEDFPKLFKPIDKDSDKKVPTVEICSCGAKHTSRPSFHLPYCKFGESR